MTNILQVALSLAACVGLEAAEAPSLRYTPKQIESAIRAGKAGAEFAERAKKMEELQVSEIRSLCHLPAAFSQRSPRLGASIRFVHSANAGVAPRQCSVSTF